MVNKDKIQGLLETYFVCSNKAWIQDDGSVQVDGDVTLIKPPPQGRIPVKFNLVSGHFKAINMGLVSLSNIPDECSELFLTNNQLTDLDDCPPYLITLDVSNNKLKNFVNGPESAHEITAYNNPLSSLEGLPDEYDELEINITYDAHLPLLRLINSTKVRVGHPGSGYKRLQPFEPVNTIINKYLGQGKSGALKAAAELVRAGYKENARW